ncbi:MAG: hypothetical protein B6I38_10055 [Anaerolineaceae bacterium 4572_5.1]|nr:MAG: hypothetical protein B6I38_10055 [Anaerolineaceae bacterium 4572_5.1]
MRIAILTYESHQSNLMTHRLLTEFPGQVVGIMRSDVIVAGKNTWQSMWFLLKRTGLGFVFRKGMEIILSRVAASLNKTQLPPLKHLGQEFDVPVVQAKNINAPDSLATLASWQPDLIISVYLNQLIKKKIIEMPPKGVINVHPALLPRNRGLFPYFWALANGQWRRRNRRDRSLGCAQI